MGESIRLSPPQIDSIIPAIQKNPLNTNAEEIDKVILRIPFQISSSTSLNGVTEVSLLIKVNTGTIKLDGKKAEFSRKANTPSTYEAIFYLDPKDWMIGQYYKVQLALVLDDIVGYYSNVGIVKCISKPTVSIQNLNSNTSNAQQYEYIGVYSTKDIDEKVYSYCFTIYDGVGKVYDTSGVQLHDTSDDTSQNESTDKWIPTKSLKAHTEYNIIYSITTISGGVANISYSIMYDISGSLLIEGGEFCGIFYEEDAYVDLHLRPTSGADIALPNGQYIVSRSSDEDNFENWVTLFNFTSAENIMNPQFGYDYTVKQGVQYKYILQQINGDGSYSLPIEAVYYLNDYNTSMNNLIVEFEHAYLFDGEKQLCIKYNPKVSSFKSTILENKVDTLGGKYPFIFKNGSVEYKEFPISGLISALMDSNRAFLSAAAGIENDRKRTPETRNDIMFNPSKTSLERDNFRIERDFKLQVLKWLTNGTIKLFRSPGEGNYIVRLMNTSLSPNDTLSRMLHTFTSTAYEIADYNIANLKLYNFIKTVSTENIAYEMIFNEIEYSSIFTAKGDSYNLSPHGGARYLEFKNQYSDFVVQIVRMNGTSLSFNVGNLTGGYFLQDLSSNPVINIVYISGTPDSDATMVIGHYGDAVMPVSNVFNLRSRSVVENKNTKEDVVQQFIGSYQMNKTNLISSIAESGTIEKFYLIQAIPKTIIKVINSDGQWYPASNYNNEEVFIQGQEINIWDLTAIYYDIENDKYYCGGCDKEPLDGLPDFSFRLNNDYYSVLATIDKGEFIDRKDFEAIKNIESVHTLMIGDGLLCNIVYQITYNHS